MVAAPKIELHQSYRVLGLPEGAPLTEVKQAYRRLALRYHPDCPGGSTATFERIERAYADLCAAVEQRRPPEREPSANVPVPLTEVHRLGEQLRNSSDPTQRLFACRSLANSGRKSAYAYIREALYDSSEMVVLTAIEAVGRLRVRHAYAEFGALFSYGSPRVRRVLLETIERIDSLDRFKSVILQALEDVDPDVRRRGLSSFARMRGGNVG